MRTFSWIYPAVNPDVNRDETGSGGGGKMRMSSNAILYCERIHSIILTKMNSCKKQNKK